MDRINTLLRRGCFIGISIVAFQEYVGGLVVCSGPSMFPTIKTKDILVTDSLSPRFGKIEKGEVVIARAPTQIQRKTGQYLCKRVVALPGDQVIYNGELMEVPIGCAWIEGDNKDNSSDSRDFGPIPLSEIKRRCLWKVWPYFETVKKQQDVL